MLVSLCGISHAQTVTLIATVTSLGTSQYSPTDVVLAAGDFATVVTQIRQVDEFAVAVEIAGKEIELPYLLAPASPFVIAGPARLRTKVTTSPADTHYLNKVGLATLNVVRPNAVPTITPQNAAVIPSDATGSSRVILESSTHLITWTAATPDTYSGTTQKRFFRTCIVKQ